MELFKYYVRQHLPVRPMLFRSIILSNSSSTVTALIFIIFIIAILLPSTCDSQTPWPVLQLPDQAERILSDERDGSVFIVVNDDIYKYDNKLKLLTSTIVSTSGKVNISENSQRTLINKLLYIVKKNNPNLLLSCWTTKEQLLNCWFNKLNDLKVGNVLKWKVNKDSFKLGHDDQILTLLNSPDSSGILLVSNKLTRSDSTTTETPYLPTISKFEIVKTNGSDGTKQLALEPKSVLLYESQSESLDVHYHYIYLFSYGHYTHFILNEIKKLSTSDIRYSVRIARVCIDDYSFTSYTEITLTCNDKTNLQATAAYLDSTKTEPTLHVVFEEYNEFSSSKSKKSNDKSLLCSYSMKLIDDITTKAVNDCYDGFQTSNLLRKFNPESQSLPCQKNPSTNIDRCHSKTNPFIDGTSYRYNIKEDSYLNLDGLSQVNFLLTTKQGDPDKGDVLFLGTESGLLTKMNFEEDLFFTLNLNNLHVKSYQLGEKLKSKATLPPHETLYRKKAEYSLNDRSIYIIANDSHTVSRVDLDACNYYDTCHACLMIGDPLDCIWCDGTCARRQDCHPQNQTTLSCPPVIRDFHPKSGSKSGFTRLKIEGENFGSSEKSIQVKVGDQNCPISLNHLTSQYLECIVQPTRQSDNATISIDVSDESGVVYSKGSAASMIPFSFVDVKVFGLTPHSGPYYNTNVLEVFGSNLDAGSNRSVYLSDNECEILEYRRDYLRCSLQALQTPIPNSLNDTAYLGTLKFFIDGVEQLVDSNDYSGSLNLSTTYTFTYNPSDRAETTMPPMSTVDQIPDSDSWSILMNLFLMVALLVLVALVILYLIRSDKIPNFKLKLPFALDSTDSKAIDAKVSFRNPQSHKFSNAGSAIGSESINGLVKLNGSVMSSGYFCKPEQFEQDQPLMCNFLDNELLTLLMQEKILIDKNRLTLGHVLGSGQFGRVYKGFLKVEDTGEHAAVAVKTLHSRSTWDDTLDNRAFLEEGLMMKDFEHENVLALIGVTFDSNGLPMVITPFMLYGDLRSYISDEASSPTVKELIDFGTQVARGMAYLSGLKFVHRDLAARNCMLDDNLVVKVADFGLSRDIYERDYYSSDNKKAKLPVKWMAIESLEKCIYNTKTDVWSYGVLLWELMTRGVVPYPDVDNFDLFSYLKEGRRMLRPRYCPVILYKIMLSCWEENPTKRPTFVQLVQEVSDVITQLRIAKDGQQKVSRDVTYCDVIR